MLPLAPKPGHGSFARKEGFGSRPDGPTHEVRECAHPLDRRQAVHDPIDGNVVVVCVLCCAFQAAVEVKP